MPSIDTTLPLLSLAALQSAAMAARRWSVDGAPSDQSAAYDPLCSELAASPDVVSGDELARLFDRRSPGDFVRLAKLIAADQVLVIRCNGAIWLPLFQFDPKDLSVLKGLGDVLAEFARVFDAREVFDWFSSPNSWLDGRCPAAVLRSDPRAVVEASRGDRFVACG